MGNLKDAKLEGLADHGNGHYAYVDSILEARRVFVARGNFSGVPPHRRAPQPEQALQLGDFGLKLCLLGIEFNHAELG